MSYQEFLPDPRLHASVRRYWQVDEFHREGQEEHHFMPERSVRLTFYAGQSWQGAPQGGELTPMPDAALFGLSLEPLRVVSCGHTRALGVELYPWGARQLFGWHAGLANLDLSPAYGRLARELCALLELGRWDEARGSLEAWLLALHQERARQHGKAVTAALRLYGSLGRARISALAAELNLSPRQLERQFVQEVGVGAKTLARLIRFEEVHNRLWLDPATPLSPLAFELGFADQAHLSREFKALSLMTPRTFAGFSRLSRQNLHGNGDTRLGHLPTSAPGAP